MNAPFEWAPLFTTEKVNEHPSLNEQTDSVMISKLRRSYLFTRNVKMTC